MLLDDASDPNAWPTGNNMRHHMRQLVANAQHGDSLLFHFSGGSSSPHPCHAVPCVASMVHIHRHSWTQRTACLQILMHAIPCGPA